MFENFIRFYTGILTCFLTMDKINNIPDYNLIKKCLKKLGFILGQIPQIANIVKAYTVNSFKSRIDRHMKMYFIFRRYGKFFKLPVP